MKVTTVSCKYLFWVAMNSAEFCNLKLPNEKRSMLKILLSCWSALLTRAFSAKRRKRQEYYCCWFLPVFYLALKDYVKINSSKLSNLRHHLSPVQISSNTWRDQKVFYNKVFWYQAQKKKTKNKDIKLTYNAQGYRFFSILFLCAVFLYVGPVYFGKSFLGASFLSMSFLLGTATYSKKDADFFFQLQWAITYLPVSSCKAWQAHWLL